MVTRDTPQIKHSMVSLPPSRPAGARGVRFPGVDRLDGPIGGVQSLLTTFPLLE